MLSRAHGQLQHDILTEEVSLPIVTFARYAFGAQMVTAENGELRFVKPSREIERTRA